MKVRLRGVARVPVRIGLALGSVKKFGNEEEESNSDCAHDGIVSFALCQH